MIRKKSELEDSQNEYYPLWSRKHQIGGSCCSEFVPENMKNIKSLDIFKQEIKKLTFDKCPCKTCKEYVQGIGYIN